jgi:hypothetical protein
MQKLPNIAMQAELPADSYEVWEVPPDDLDAAVGTMLEAIAKLKQRFPQTEVVADYTGGTKTMTAALVMAALESESVQLRLVTGARGDLIQVHDGSQMGVAVSAERIRLRRAMAPYIAAWDRYAYGEAADGLYRLPAPQSADLRAELQITLDMSRAFDAWDRFDHSAARRQCGVYRRRLGPVMGNSLKFLDILASPADPKRMPARLWDLWLNARRRAAQGRYDDAVARLYRLIEWTAQWLLEEKGIDTSNLRRDQIPSDMSIAPNRDGKYQAGLVTAWELVGQHVPGPPAEFAFSERKRMRDYILTRNDSILAHGDTPINQAEWNRFSGWVQDAMIPLLKHAGTKAGFRMEPPQLPTTRPWCPTVGEKHNGNRA